MLWGRSAVCFVVVVGVVVFEVVAVAAEEVMGCEWELEWEEEEEDGVEEGSWRNELSGLISGPVVVGWWWWWSPFSMGVAVAVAVAEVGGGWARWLEEVGVGGRSLS
jgi:hypothetical protein